MLGSATMECDSPGGVARRVSVWLRETMASLVGVRLRGWMGFCASGRRQPFAPFADQLLGDAAARWEACFRARIWSIFGDANSCQGDMYRLRRMDFAFV